MINKLYSHNFKAFKDVDIELKPITLFFGPNNSGKSSILSILKLLVQTLESNDKNIKLLLNGIFGDFGTFKDIVYLNNDEEHLNLGFSFNNKNINYFLKMDYSYKSDIREILLNEFVLRKDNQLIYKLKYNKDKEKYFFDSGYFFDEKNIINNESKSSNFIFENFMPRLFLSEILGNNFKKNTENDYNKYKFFLEKSFEINELDIEIRRQLLNVDYLSSMRIPPKRTFLYSGEKNIRIGATGESYANILAMDSARKGRKSKGILEKTKKWLESAEIASDIKIQNISERHYEIRLQHPLTKEYENLVDVGCGNSQVFPVLIGGYNLDKGNTFIVEEPEIHLHPRAQAQLGNFFLDLKNNGVQSIIETHSEYLLIRLQQLIVRGDISPQDIIIYYICANDDGKQIFEITIDENGVINENIPGGFFSERLNEAKKLSKIRYSKMEGEEEWM